MSKRISAVLALGMIALLAPASAIAVDEETHQICGFVSEASPALITAGITIGETFAATLTTDNDQGNNDPNLAECASNCGTLFSDTRGVIVTGAVTSIIASPVYWTAEAFADTFELTAGSGVFATATVDTTLYAKDASSPRVDPSKIHPNFPTGAITGSADVAITAIGIPGTPTLTADIRWVGPYVASSAIPCPFIVPTLPVWGFPLLGIAMLTTAGAMIRRRA